MARQSRKKSGDSTSTAAENVVEDEKEVEHSKNRLELKERSLGRGGFGDLRTRRSAWLYLLDLSHLEADLPKILEGERDEEVEIQQEEKADEVVLQPDSIPIDNEGWQITTHNLDASIQADEAQEMRESREGEEEWNLATSKRKKRGKRKQEFEQQADLSPQTSETVTASSSSGSRTTSTSGHAPMENGNSSATIEVDRKAERRSRKAKKRTKAKSGPDDLNASIVHVQRSPSQDLGADGKHKDEEQVALDIRRSFIYLGQAQSRKVRQEELSTVVNGVLRRYPRLHYYQGFHDVISVILTVFIPHTNVDGVKAAAAAADEKALEAVIDFSSRLSLHFLRDAMTENMTPTLGHLKVLRNILRKSHDDALAKRVETASPLPYFALPWLLSMFAHELDVKRSALVFDYLLPRGPTSLLYLCGALIERNKKSVEAMESDDPAELHHALAQLPSLLSEEALPDVLRHADRLAILAPIPSLDEKGVMGKSSVLYSWSLLPWHESSEWVAADERASEILQGSIDDIVVDALPSPPASEHGDETITTSDELIRNDKALVAKRWWRGARKGKADANLGGGALFAWVGAFGALGAALIIVYGANGGSSSSSSAAFGQALGRHPSSVGLGSGFPVGLRAAEMFKGFLRNGFPF